MDAFALLLVFGLSRVKAAWPVLQYLSSAIDAVDRTLTCLPANVHTRVDGVQMSVTTEEPYRNKQAQQERCGPRPRQSNADWFGEDVPHCLCHPGAVDHPGDC